MGTVPKPTGYGKFVTVDKNDEKFRDSKPLPPTKNQCIEIYPKLTDIARSNDDDNLRDCTVIEHPNKGTTETDFGVSDVFNIVKSLDVNRYATKKTIAQGMLDIALLTANASQLKYILQVGKQHEFYTLMLTLICISIGLQLLQGFICIVLASTYNINKSKDQRKANIWNNISLALMLLIVAVNVIISAFEIRETNDRNSNFVKKSDIR